MKHTLAILLFVPVLLSNCYYCNGGTTSSYSEGPKFIKNIYTAENCNVEFFRLTNASYDLSYAISETESFINKWAHTGFYQVDDARRIKGALEDIKLFIKSYGHNLADFKAQAIVEASKYDDSDYRIVRSAWNKAVGEKEHSLAKSLLASCDENAFTRAMEKSMSNIIDSNARSFFGWDIESMDVVKISEPEQKGSWSKSCTATFRVYLVGALIGLDSTTTKVEITEEMGINSSGNLYSSLVDYTILENNF